MISSRFVAFFLSAAFAATFGHTAKAFVVGSSTNVDFTGGSVSFAFDGSEFTFSDNGTSPFDGSPVSVMTSASGGVTALGEPFYSQPTPSTFFDPVRGDGVLVFDSSSGYSPFLTPTAIPFSASPFFIGLEVTDAGGTFFGYGELAGTDLVSYAFESTAGVGIQAGAPIPEPGALLLFATGLVGLTLRFRKKA